MTLTHWNPWSGFLSTEGLTPLSSLMDEVFAAQGGQGHLMPSSLPIDVRQTDEAFYIEASIPGFKPEEVQITYEDGALTVQAHKEENQETNQGDYVRRERRVSSYYRQVGLPSEINEEGISADFTDGVLTLTVPRIAKSQPKKIQIAAGSNSKTTVKHVEAGKNSEKESNSNPKNN